MLIWYVSLIYQFNMSKSKTFFIGWAIIILMAPELQDKSPQVLENWIKVSWLGMLKNFNQTLTSL